MEESEVQRNNWSPPYRIKEKLQRTGEYFGYLREGRLLSRNDTELAQDSIAMTKGTLEKDRDMQKHLLEAMNRQNVLLICQQTMQYMRTGEYFGYLREERLLSRDDTELAQDSIA
ncbi:hypothetical protein UY3_02511 [Chelonia mydas]|uniref:Uncharacterized protein n=1 Tax=Chelonia mydas TaxID=8469 RepID=M7C759_CHEMY|nr:hypothetical protein UY3_02511 [Chelonia mydas]